MRRRNKFIDKFNSISVSTKFLLSLVVTVILLSITYAAFGTKLSITGAVAKVRVKTDIRVTGISVYNTTNEGLSNYEEYNVNKISTSVTLPKSGSNVYYTVSVTNYGNTNMGIYQVTGCPSNLRCDPVGYTLKKKLCDTNGSCNLGSTTQFRIRIRYKSSSYYNAENTTFPISLGLDFRPMYTITYTGVGVSGSDYMGTMPTEVIQGGSVNFSFIDGDNYAYSIIMGGTTYQCGSDSMVCPGTGASFGVSNVTGNITVVGARKENAFCEPYLIPTLFSGVTGKSPEDNYELLDEYKCDVDGNGTYRNFVVIGTNSDGSVNLMYFDSTDLANYNSVWGTSVSNGPDSAFSVLNSSTNTGSWSNIIYPYAAYSTDKYLAFAISKARLITTADLTNMCMFNTSTKVCSLSTFNTLPDFWTMDVGSGSSGKPYYFSGGSLIEEQDYDVEEKTALPVITVYPGQLKDVVRSGDTFSAQVTNLICEYTTNSGVCNSKSFSSDTLNMNLTLPSSNSTVKYKVTMMNSGSAYAAIKSISGLPSNLKYTLTGYNIGQKICDTSGNCKSGIIKEFYITIAYKTSSDYDANNTTFDVTLNLDIKPMYNVTYSGVGITGDNLIGAPTEIVHDGIISMFQEGNFNYTFTMGGELITCGTSQTSSPCYVSNGLLRVNNVTGDVNIHGTAN